MISVLVLVASLLALAWYYINQLYSYWERHGFPYDKNTSIPFGCLGSVFRREKGMGMAVYDVYTRSKERFLGVYLCFRPAVLVRDVELVRHVLAQDFSSFHDRGIYVDEEKNPLSAHLFALRGQSWHSMRNKLSPCFSSGKLKAMFSTSEDISNKLVAHLEKLLPQQGAVELNMKELLETYAVDIIASVIFGLDINSFEQPNNKFRKLVPLLRRNTRLSAVFAVLIFLIPSVAKFLFRLGLKNPVGLAMLEIVKDTMDQREQQNIVRKDMLQLLMQLRNTGKIAEDDNNWSIQKSEDGKIQGISNEVIAAQAFIFYVAGQETTASTAALTLFELAQYPEHLQRLQKEVDATLEQNNGQITYDALQKMEFLDLCICETLRKYPGLPLLNRECTQDYVIPGTNQLIKKGTSVLISLFGLHRDPEYFPEPDKYDPERFSAEQLNYNAEAYMPFGEGPRICIAQRMGRVNSKLAIVKILQNFELEIMSRREMEFDNHTIALLPKGGVKLRLSRRCKN